jgi:Cu(I)/Ag(I) efflux system periplasmic protein CusF
MNKFAQLTTALLMVAVSLFSGHLFAQTTPELTGAEVRKIDKEAQKITLKHGEIRNLDMPPMTMVFKVLDPALLDKVKAGDQVYFSAEKRDGAFFVLTIETAK